MQEVFSKLARWLIFTVALSIAPLVVDGIHRVSSGSLKTIDQLVAHGELAIVYTALAGVAVGELLGLSDRGKVAKTVLGGACFISALLSVFLYVDMHSIRADEGAMFLNNLSWYLFWEVVFVGTISIVVSEALK